MERKAIAAPLGVVVIAAVAWFTLRPAGLRFESLRVVPPAPGECVGRVEATVVNGTSEAVDIGSLVVRQDGRDRRSRCFSVFPLKEGGPEFATFAPGAPIYRGRSALEPGASRVLVAAVARLRGGAAARLSIHGEVYARPESARKGVTLETLPADLDPAAWPLPIMMGPEALDRALREGHELSIAVDSAALPGAGEFALEIGPGGHARGGGWGRWPGRPDGSQVFQASGTLTPAQQASLRAAVRAAPFAAFLADPGNLDVEDGRPVHLLVAAGPAVFAACSQEEDYVAAGLKPLLDHLRDLLRDLPDAERGR